MSLIFWILSKSFIVHFWRKPSRWFIEEDKFRLNHKGSSNGYHLLLSTRELSCNLISFFHKIWIKFKDFIKVSENSSFLKICAHLKIFLNCEVGEYIFYLRYVGNTLFNDTLSIHICNFFFIEVDVSFFYRDKTKY